MDTVETVDPAPARAAANPPVTESVPGAPEPSPQQLGICELFEQRVRQTTKGIAIKTGAAELTFGALNQCANRLAHAILSLDLPEEAPVAFLLEYGAPQITAIFGILKAGRIYAALDADLYPTSRLAYLADYLQTRLIVTDHAHLALARKVSGGKAELLNLEALDADLPAENPSIRRPPESTAVILFTSGSTGEPKGVMHSHRTLLASAQRRPGVDYDDMKVLLHVSCSYVASLGFIFGGLVNGAALFPYHLKKQALADLPRWMLEVGITHCFFFTSTFRHFAGLLKGETFPRLKLVALGGEAVSAREVEQWRKITGPDCRLSCGFGATEALSVTAQSLGKDASPTESMLPLGNPTPGSVVLLLDEDGKEVAPGEIGEIVVSSPLMAQGYWRDPALTGRTFRPDPRNPGGYLYYSGDLAVRRPDGRLMHCGRKDFQEKIRGHRVNPGEIESVLLELEGVKEAVVAGRDDGCGGRRLVAYVVPAGAGPSVDAMRDRLGTRLPAHMLPAAFVFLEALPTTGTGKIDRAALPEPGAGRPELGTAYEPPLDPLETQLVELWQEYLEVRPIGIHDDFFALGGDSLSASKMLDAVETRLAVAISAADLLGAFTIAHLAAAVRQRAVHSVQQRLVEIQPGSAGRRLFFAHGDYREGGLYCVHLARLLGRDQGFFALPPHGLAEPFLVPRTIEEMAQENVQALTAFRHDGPHWLGGHSNGALIAFQMARRLQAQGKRVAGVLMVAPPPISLRRAGMWSSLRRAILPNGARRGKPRAVSQLSREERRSALARIYNDACRSYRAEPLAAPVIVIEAQDDEVVPKGTGASGPDLKAIAAEVTVESIPGGHFSILSTHLEGLAECLKKHLSRTAFA